jgi:hypothetical protein
MTTKHHFGVVVAAIVLGVALVVAAPEANAESSHTPLGSLDGVARIIDAVRVTGWAIDPDSEPLPPCGNQNPCHTGSQPIDVHVYVDGGIAAIATADQQRLDLDSFGSGEWHGFDVTIPLDAGVHEVCVFAINVGPDEPNPLLGPGCRSVHATPIGNFEDALQTTTGIHVVGWTLDHDTTDPIDVHVYVDGQIAAARTANVARPDVANVYPADGPNHGFDMVIPIGSGTHTLCVFAINVGPPEANPLLGCPTVSLDPIGSFETHAPVSGGVHVGGWAIDPNTTAPIHVHVYVDNIGTDIGDAALPRVDVSDHYPGYGANHGFDTVVLASSGQHRVCAYAINDTPPGPNPLLGVFTSDSCYTVTVP